LPHRGWRGRALWFVTALIATALLVAGLLVGPFGGIGHAATSPVTVSLTFDDSNADQLPAEQTMKAAGLHGTFYTVSGWIGMPSYLTLANLRQIAADGNEIAGHTINHPDLPTLDPQEQLREVCNDRVNLINWGFQPTSFAYPFADADTNETAAAACGYNSARGLGDVRSPSSCRRCVYAETTPPPDPYYLRAPDEVDSTWSLATMEREVTQAQNNGGGWVILTFHHICSPIGTTACPSDLSTTPTIFNQFVTWLKGQSSVGTTVKTVQQVIGGSFKPGVTVNPPPPTNTLQNQSLETTDSSTGFPKCWQAGGWGTNTVAWANTSAAHTGTHAENLTVTNYSNGDAKLLPTLDQGTCSPTVVPGNTYNLSVWYKSTGTTQFALYYRTTSGAWVYWTSSPWFATASTWTQATFTTPAVPAGANGMSFGLALITNGSLTTDDYGLATATTAAKASSAAPAGIQMLGAVSPITIGATVTVHSHAKPYIPGKGRVKPGQRILLPEPSPGPHAKSNT
jgi:peptidoglycan/xylan/chitin deacetylase (PgdA/CDA1 family)